MAEMRMQVTPVLNEPVALYCGLYFGHRDLRINFRTHTGWFPYNEFIVDDDPSYIPVDEGRLQTDVNQTRIAYVEQNVISGNQELRFANALSSSIGLYHIGVVYRANPSSTLGSVAIAVDSVTGNPRIAFVVHATNDTLCYAQWTGNEWQIDRLVVSPVEIISAAAVVAPNRESHLAITTVDGKDPYHCMSIYMHGTEPFFLKKGSASTECFNCFDYDTVMSWRAGADLISASALALTRTGAPLIAYNAEFCPSVGNCSGSIMLAQRRPTVSVDAAMQVAATPALSVAAIGFPSSTGALRLAIQSSLTQVVVMDLYDVQGRATGTVRTVEVVPGLAGYDVQFAHLGRGVYFLRARGNREGVTTTKLVFAR